MCHLIESVKARTERGKERKKERRRKEKKSETRKCKVLKTGGDWCPVDGIGREQKDAATKGTGLAEIRLTVGDDRLGE
jgi:hypothetical protein